MKKEKRKCPKCKGKTFFNNIGEAWYCNGCGWEGNLKEEIEIRYDKDSQEIDEIIYKKFHLEKMDKNRAWFCIGNYHFNIQIFDGKLSIECV